MSHLDQVIPSDRNIDLRPKRSFKVFSGISSAWGKSSTKPESKMGFLNHFINTSIDNRMKTDHDREETEWSSDSLVIDQPGNYSKEKPWLMNSQKALRSSQLQKNRVFSKTHMVLNESDALRDQKKFKIKQKKEKLPLNHNQRIEEKPENAWVSPEFKKKKSTSGILEKYGLGKKDSWKEKPKKEFRIGGGLARNLGSKETLEFEEVRGLWENNSKVMKLEEDHFRTNDKRKQKEKLKKSREVQETKGNGKKTQNEESRGDKKRLEMDERPLQETKEVLKKEKATKTKKPKFQLQKVQETEEISEITFQKGKEKEFFKPALKLWTNEPEKVKKISRTKGKTGSQDQNKMERLEFIKGLIGLSKIKAENQSTKVAKKIAKAKSNKEQLQKAEKRGNHSSGRGNKPTSNGQFCRDELAQPINKRELPQDFVIFIESDSPENEKMKSLMEIHLEQHLSMPVIEESKEKMSPSSSLFKASFESLEKLSPGLKKTSSSPKKGHRESTERTSPSHQKDKMKIFESQETFGPQIKLTNDESTKSKKEENSSLKAVSYLAVPSIHKRDSVESLSNLRDLQRLEILKKKISHETGSDSAASQKETSKVVKLSFEKMLAPSQNQRKSGNSLGNLDRGFDKSGKNEVYQASNSERDVLRVGNNTNEQETCELGFQQRFYRKEIEEMASNMKKEEDYQGNELDSIDEDEQSIHRILSSTEQSITDESLSPLTYEKNKAPPESIEGQRSPSELRSPKGKETNFSIGGGSNNPEWVSEFEEGKVEGLENYDIKRVSRQTFMESQDDLIQFGRSGELKDEAKNQLECGESSQPVTPVDKQNIEIDETDLNEMRQQAQFFDNYRMKLTTNKSLSIDYSMDRTQNNLNDPNRMSLLELDISIHSPNQRGKSEEQKFPEPKVSVNSDDWPSSGDLNKGAKSRAMANPQNNVSVLNESMSLNISRFDKYKFQDSICKFTNHLDVTINEDQEKQINDYAIRKNLGKGGFGKVKLAYHTSEKKHYAIKIANKKLLQRKYLSKNETGLTLLQKEIAVMKLINHPNTVKLWEVIDDDKKDKLYLVMDFVKKGAIMSKRYWQKENKPKASMTILDDSIIAGDTSFTRNEPKVLSEAKCLKYFRDFMLGLDYLHNFCHIIHRDIKPENLLIDETDHLKIADFGMAHIFEGSTDEVNTQHGTKCFMAPELWGGRSVEKSYKGKPLDIWAAGCTLYYFAVGKNPFQSMDMENLKKKVMEDEPYYPSSLNRAMVDLIQKCLIKNPSERIDLEEILVHPWVTSDGKQPLYNEETIGAPTLTKVDIDEALTKKSAVPTLKTVVKIHQHLNRTRENIKKKKESGANPKNSQSVMLVPFGEGDAD